MQVHICASRIHPVERVYIRREVQVDAQETCAAELGANTGTYEFRVSAPVRNGNSGSVGGLEPAAKPVDNVRGVVLRDQLRRVDPLDFKIKLVHRSHSRFLPPAWGAIRNPRSAKGQGASGNRTAPRKLRHGWVIRSKPKSGKTARDLPRLQGKPSARAPGSNSKSRLLLLRTETVSMSDDSEPNVHFTRVIRAPIEAMAGH
jgi:hypothetical protein